MPGFVQEQNEAHKRSK